MYRAIAVARYPKIFLVNLRQVRVDDESKKQKFTARATVPCSLPSSRPVVGSLMRLLHLVLISALYISSTWALHESEVGVVDWHKRLIGVPLSGSSPTAPTFHRVGNSKSTKSVVLTATGSNVLTALNPVNGSVGVFDPKNQLTTTG